MKPIGHALSVQLLQNALDQERIHNAYLFVGSQGVGKRTLARWLAEQLLYLPDKRHLPLDRHPDFYTLEPLDTETGKRAVIKVDAVQSLIRYLRQQPLVSSRSVILIDQADTLTVSAANALLKTLEEPRKAVLLLTTDQLDAVVTTIRSRCQTLYLQTLSESECQAVLAPYVTPAPTELVALAPGQPGQILQHCRMVNALAPLSSVLAQGVRSPHECLGLAQSLKALTQTQQMWLLQWWQRSLFDQPHLLECFDHAIAQLQQSVQPELAWDVLLLQLNRNGVWAVDLPEPVSLHEPILVIAEEAVERTKLAKSHQTRKSNGSKKTKSIATVRPADVEQTTATLDVQTPQPPALKQLTLFPKRTVTGSS
jgi:DNA polymerase-3 subunit delta'